MSIACIIFIGSLPCAGQHGNIQFKPDRARAGIDIADGICQKTIRVMISHSFTSHWSATADIGLDVGLMKSPAAEIEMNHLTALSDMTQSENTQKEFRQTFQDICIYIDYWPSHAFKGPHIFIGGSFKDRSGPDLIFGAGYSINIWKGLSTDIMYRFGIIETYKDRQLSVTGIKAGICYVF